jgi:hypothetical protein
MTIWQPYDFGYPLAGRSGLITTGTNQATAQPVTVKINVFQNVATGTGCILPSSYSPGAEIHILNRGANALTVYPALGDQIENNGVNVPMTVNQGGTFVVVSFDAPLARQPRTWWLDVGANTSGGPTPPGGDGLGNDQGVLLLLNATGWPTSSGAPGSLYNLGGTIGCSGPTTPNPNAVPVVFGFITSVALLALGGANLPTTSPAVGSNIIWNQGGLLCVA